MNRRFRTLTKAREYRLADMKWDLESLRLDMYCTDQDIEDLRAEFNRRLDSVEDQVDSLEQDCVTQSDIEGLMDEDAVYDLLSGYDFDDVIDSWNDENFLDRFESAMRHYDLEPLMDDGLDSVLDEAFADNISKSDLVSTWDLEESVRDAIDDHDFQSEVDFCIRNYDLDLLAENTKLAQTVKELESRVVMLEVLADLEKIAHE